MSFYPNAPRNAAYYAVWDLDGVREGVPDYKADRDESYQSMDITGDVYPVRYRTGQHGFASLAIYELELASYWNNIAERGPISTSDGAIRLLTPQSKSSMVMTELASYSRMGLWALVRFDKLAASTV